MSQRITAVVLATLLLSACQTSTDEPSSREKFIESRGLADYNSVEFQDERGSSIAFEQFSVLAEVNRGYSIIKNRDTSEAIIRINVADEEAATSIAEEPKLAILPGMPVPRIESADLGGSLVSYVDKPTLVSFFFAECAPCIKEIPQINSLASELPHIQFISLTFDEESIARSFVSSYQLKTRVVADEQKFIDSMGVKTYPVYALIGTDGRLLGTQSGATLQLPFGERIFKRWIRSKLAA